MSWPNWNFLQPKLIGKFRTRHDWPGDAWWRQRLLMRIALGNAKADSLQIPHSQLRKMRSVVDRSATLEALPTETGIVNQYLPFEHFLILQEGSTSDDTVPRALRDYFESVNPLIDRRLRPRILYLRGILPDRQGDHNCHVYFGLSVFVPRDRHEPPRGRAYIRVKAAYDSKVSREFNLVFGGRKGGVLAGWYLRQDRLCFSGWAEAPSVPLDLSGQNQNIRDLLDEDQIYAVSCLPQEPSPILSGRHRRQAGTGSPEDRSLIDPAKDSDPEPTMLTPAAWDKEDLVYEAPLPQTGKTLAYDIYRNISLCIEPNSSVSRLRKAAAFAGPVFLEVLGVLVPRALRVNKVVEMSVHVDSDNQLLAHGFRRHAVSLLLRRRNDWLSEVLAPLRLQDSDQILRCTEHGSEAVSAYFGIHGGQELFDIRMSKTSAVAYDIEICNALPIDVALRQNPGLPADYCYLVHRSGLEPMGYIALPLYKKVPDGPDWTGPMTMELTRKNRESNPDREFLIDWLDEAIDIETETGEDESLRQGYAEWLANSAPPDHYGYLAPQSCLMVRADESLLVEEFETGKVETALVVNRIYRIGPLILRLRYQ